MFDYSSIDHYYIHVAEKTSLIYYCKSSKLTVMKQS